MNSSKSLVKLLGLAFIAASSAQAKEKVKIEEIIVKAPAPIFLPATDIYDTDSFTPSYTNSDGADYLKSTAGLTAGRFGGHGLELFMRGQSQNQLNIIADNAFTFGGCPNRMDPPSAYLNINSYDTIKITKGYQSVLNGPGASGGTIILERNAPQLNSELTIKGELLGGFDGNSNQRDASANIIAGNKNSYVRAYSSVKNSDNYKDGNGDKVRSSFDEKTGGMTIGFTPNKSHIYFSYDINQIEDALFPGAGMDSPLSKGQVFRAGFEKKYDLGLVRNIDASAYSSLVDHVMDNYSLRNTTSSFSKTNSTSKTFGGKIKTDLSLFRKIFKTSLEYRSNNRDADMLSGNSRDNVNRLQTVMWPDITSKEIGLAAQTTHDFSKISRLVIGGRYDNVNVDYGRSDQKASVTNKSANDVYKLFYGYGASNRSENNFGGLLRYEHDLGKDITFYSGLSRSVRTADATERGLANYMVMMGNNQSWVGNPKINPEKHHQLDIGISKNAKEWDFDVSAYINRVSDFILRDSARIQDGILLNAPNADVYRNVDALLSGLEVKGGWNLSSKIRINGNATYTYGKNIDDKMPLAQIPPLQGRLGLSWWVSEYVNFESDMRFAFKQSRVDTDPTIGTGRDYGKTSGYTVLDLSATVTKLKPASFRIGISNLLDKKYANHLSRSNITDPTQVRVNEPGRSFYIKAKFPF